MRGSVDRKDLFLMLILSLLFFSIAVYDLGLLKIPVSGWNSSSDGEVNFDLGSQKRVDCLYVFLADSRPVSFDVYVEVSGSWQYQRSFYDSDYYNWKRLELHRVSTRFVKLVFHGSVGMVNEIYFVDEDGERIRIEQVWVEGRPVGDVENLIDEQELIENPPTYRSRTYFDEIYYVRTAENYIKGEEPYEWTHPPFGKLIIALSILSLGFNPFGWRFTGVLFASMMVPMVYILAKIMFRDRLAATFSASLLSLDFLHFTMGRIATVDTFAVFFILTSNIFFFITYQRLSGSEARFDGLNFLLGVLFFSLAFSTKWYALYGFIGQFLLILFFLIRSLRASRCGLKGLLKPLTIILGALVLALTVYASSFIPHLLLGHSLQDVI
ncbi:MAG: phospholipid carrier-dependent glycosyltransferase, partial [Candidatus Bathyarchaeia archaeon]